MDDLRDLLNILKAHNVQFIIIGAHALAHHGHPRATKDVDIWVKQEPENAQRLRFPLSEFGAKISEGDSVSFGSVDRQMIRLGVPPQMVDILNFAGRESFDSVWSGSVEGQLLDVSVHFPSKVALIEMKREAGRPQDLVDISKLGG